MAPTTYNFTCEECQKNFTHERHYKHHLKSHQLPSAIKKNFEFACDHCDKKFALKRHLTFHLKDHGIFTQKEIKDKRKCPLCDYINSYKKELYIHFAQTHDIEIKVEELQFEKIDNFNDWKKSIENDTKSKFVKECGTKSTKTNKESKFICHRSGCYIPTGKYFSYSLFLISI